MGLLNALLSNSDGGGSGDSYLRSRVEAASSTANRALSKAESTERKMSGLNADLKILVDEIRAFTKEISKLSLLSESRHHTYLMDTRLEKEFAACVETRRWAGRLSQTLGDPAAVALPDAESTRLLASVSQKYWLASAVLSVKAWLENDRAALDPHLRNALIEDDAKGSLFMCFVSRKTGKNRAAGAWLKRYLSAQNPEDLSATARNVFLAAASGEFGVDGWEIAKRGAGDWVARALMESDGEKAAFAGWDAIVSANRRPPDAEAYPLLKEHCPAWKNIETCLALEGERAGLQQFFAQLGGRPENGASATPSHLGSIFAALIGEYQQDERLLRDEVRISRLLIEEHGDLEAAKARREEELKAGNTGKPLPVFLGNIIAGVATTTPTVRKLALELSKPWIEAEIEKTARAFQEAVPVEIGIAVGKWTGTTIRGENQSDLRASLSRHYDDIKEETIRRIRPWWKNGIFIGAALVAGALGAATATTVIGPLACVAGIIFFAMHCMKESDKEKNLVATKCGDTRTEKLATLDKIIQEISSLKRFLADRKDGFAQIREELSAVRAEPPPDVGAAGDGTDALPGQPRAAAFPEPPILPPDLSVHSSS